MCSHNAVTARPLQIVLVNFKKVAPKLLKSCSKVARKLEKLLLNLKKLLIIASIFHGCSYKKKIKTEQVQFIVLSKQNNFKKRF